MRSMQWQLGILGTISAFAYRHRETKKNLCRGGRSQDLPNTDFQPTCFNADGRGSKFLISVGHYAPNYTASHSGKPKPRHSSQTALNSTQDTSKVADNRLESDTVWINQNGRTVRLDGTFQVCRTTQIKKIKFNTKNTRNDFYGVRAFRHNSYVLFTSCRLFSVMLQNFLFL